MLLSVADKRPAQFDLEASLTTTSTREMNRRDSFMSIHSEMAGEFEYSVTVEAVAEEEDEE